MSLFEEKNIAPMLIGADGDAFDDVNYLFEIKWDGERCIAYLDPKAGTELRNKRNVKMLPKVPELSEIHKQVTKRCILGWGTDGAKGRQTGLFRDTAP